jgi:hypothetical protein
VVKHLPTKLEAKKQNKTKQKRGHIYNILSAVSVFLKRKFGST